MNRIPIANIIFNDSYNSSGLRSLGRNGIMAKGSKNALILGDGKPSAFRGVTLQAGIAGSRYASQVGEDWGGLGNYVQTNVLGSITRILSALMFSGSGEVFYKGVSLGATASSILQIKILQGGVWSATFQAGLSQPVAPTLTLRDVLGVGMTGKLKSSGSVKIHKIRTATGARSVASAASNLIIASEVNGVGKSARLTFGAADTNGGDAWGIDATPARYGSTGPWFLYKEILESDLTTIDGVPRSYELEWTDGDLQTKLAPTESFQPTACVFSGAIGSYFFVDGAFGDTVSGVSSSNPGSTIAVALGLRPEEFPGDWLLFPPEPPTALIRGGEGFYYRFGKNSMGVISEGGSEPPLSFQLYWANVGINYPHNACTGEGGLLYAKTGQRGLVRIAYGGAIDTAFANAVSDELAELDDENTVLGWDENSQHLAVFHLFEVWCFNASVGRWAAPLDLTGKISGKVVSAYTNHGTLFINCEDAGSGAIRTYKFNAGTGSTIEQRSEWIFPQSETAMLREVTITLRCDNVNPLEVRVYADEDDDNYLLQRFITPKKTGLVKLPPLMLSTKQVQSFALHLKGTSSGGDYGFERIDVNGVPRNVRK